MNKLFLYMMVIVSCFVLSSPVAWAGDFTLRSVDSSGAWYEYTGTVYEDDHKQLREIMEFYPCQRVFVIINSGGGSAFGGLNLFWEAERWDNLITIAGKDYGAWSAAAVFWLGSPRDFFEGEDSVVCFHQAYCNPWSPPGCDIGPYVVEAIPAYNKGGLFGYVFNHALDDIQRVWGVSGWLMLTDEGWFFHHSQHHFKIKTNPVWIFNGG